MKLHTFVAQRFNKSDRTHMSRPAVRIAITGIALGLAVMLIAIAVISGFKQEVRNQIIGFGSHIQILPYITQDTTDSQPLVIPPTLENQLKAIDNVSAIQHVITKPGIINTTTAFQGIILKGVDSTYNWDFFARNMVEGHTLDNTADSINNPAIISTAVAKAMTLKMGDSFTAYFVSNSLRARKFTVSGIYQTTFSDYDKLYVLTDLKHPQQLNNWNSDQYSSIELLIDDYDQLNRVSEEVFMASLFTSGADYPTPRVETIETLTPQIFDWLDMLDVNAIVILVLMTAVSGFCIISGLLILILERSATIGLFKALGATNSTIRRIFLTQAMYLISKGMAIGNLIGLTIIVVQYFTHIIPLDPSSYYVDHVPVSLSPLTWLILNIALATVSTLMLIAPSHLVAHISPAEAMRKE